MDFGASGQAWAVKMTSGWMPEWGKLGGYGETPATET